MTRFLVGLAALCLGVFVVASAGAADEQAQAQDQRNPEAIFKKLDANNDGKLSKDEFAKFADQIKDKLGDKGAKFAELIGGSFDRLDANKDGSLSLEEFKNSPFGGAGAGGFKGKFGKNPEDIKKKLEELKKNFGGGNAEDFKKKFEELKKKFGGNPEEIKKKVEDALKNAGVNAEDLQKLIEDALQNINPDDLRKQIEDALKNFGGNPEDFKKKLEEFRKKKAGDK
jgi:Ca2+-binding EF-hand superfamily protein